MWPQSSAAVPADGMHSTRQPCTAQSSSPASRIGMHYGCICHITTLAFTMCTGLTDWEAAGPSGTGVHLELSAISESGASRRQADEAPAASCVARRRCRKNCRRTSAHSTAHTPDVTCAEQLLAWVKVRALKLICDFMPLRMVDTASATTHVNAGCLGIFAKGKENTA
jgi:hypothetical protein